MINIHVIFDDEYTCMTDIVTHIVMQVAGNKLLTYI